MVQTDLQVIFWGVRGSIAVPGPDTAIFGGNTSCVQIQIGKRLFIMDSGTGIHKLGQKLLKQPSGSVKGDIFITHTHWDHIQGFPLFGPAFMTGNHFTLYGQNKMDLTFSDLMKGQMMYEHFPVSLDEMGADINFHELSGVETLDLGDGIELRTILLNHPGGAVGYRLDHAGRSCCYLSDNEHAAEFEQDLKLFVDGADLVIYDANFTDEEYLGNVGYSQKKGWGHSTWQEGIKLVIAARAKKLVLFHHANFRNDRDMEIVEQAAQAVYPNCVAAREGMVINL
ncbi:MAG: MBL fold metallo-hydrolase [Desulfosporosinus sp.]